MLFAASSTVNVAIVSPVAVYGKSPSLEHPLPLTLPHLLNVIKFVNAGFTISAGLNISSYIHVMDVARLYIILLSRALDAEGVESDVLVWGREAYYFGSDRELSFLNYMKAVVAVLRRQGALETPDIKQIDLESTTKRILGSEETPAPESWAQHVAVMFGCNMRVRSSRGRSLGWVPKEEGVEATLEEVISKYLNIIK